MILLVSSNSDVASINIADQILRHFSFQKTLDVFQGNSVYVARFNQKMVTFIRLNEDLINAQDILESFFDVELVIFISRHSSQRGIPTLTVHTPGNFADAVFGGLPRTVSVSPAAAVSNTLRMLAFFQQKFGSSEYEVSFEVTHHGPSLSVPTMFVELGSSVSQWTDAKAAYVIACSVISTIENFESKPVQKAVIGIGGTHYNKKFTYMALNGEAIFGHMIPKYAVAHVDISMLNHCVERSLEQISEVLLDWSGIKGEDKSGLLTALDASGLVYRKI